MTTNKQQEVETMEKAVIRFELKKLIRDRGLTFEQFGQLMEPPMDKATISRLANNSGLVRLETIERIANALDLEPHEMADLFKLYK